MSGFGYDPELPAGLQDADLEMAELTAAANREARAAATTFKRRMGKAPGSSLGAGNRCRHRGPSLPQSKPPACGAGDFRNEP